VLDSVAGRDGFAGLGARAGGGGLSIDVRHGSASGA
jgi:hypothetical protein